MKIKPLSGSTRGGVQQELLFVCQLRLLLSSDSQEMLIIRPKADGYILVMFQMTVWGLRYTMLRCLLRV